jgi:hypothetical protein
MLSLLGLMMIVGADARVVPTDMYSLSEQELRPRIVGKQIQTTDEPPPGLDYVTTEWFTKDGRYFRFFHGHEALGTYRFVDDMICVRLDDRERCRTGLTDSNGDLWLLSKGQDRTRIRRHAISELNW